MASARDVVPWVVAGLSLGVACACLLELSRSKGTIKAPRKVRRRIESRERRRQGRRKLRATDALVAGVELGGTTCVAALVRLSASTQIIDRFEVPTTGPRETLSKIIEWLDDKAPFAALGIATFGPIDLRTDSESYGLITTTPKAGWANFPLLKQFARYAEHAPCPIGFDTDVNAPALLELAHKTHGNDVSSCAYITVGTGIGVGLVVNGAPVHGLMHPEGGHIMPMRHPDDTYEGCSRLHPGSVESLAAAKACSERCGVSMNELASVDDDHPAWNMVAYYLAQLCIAITYIASPHVIVLSGGVMKRSSLFAKIRSHFRTLNDGYVYVPKVVDHLDEYIVPSTYANDAGILGACELGIRALKP